MAAPILLRHFLLHRLRYHNYQLFTAGAVAAPHRYRLWCSATSSSEEANEKASCVTNTRTSNRDQRWDDPDWKNKKEEILRDIEPIVTLTKDILHSPRYMDGEQLTVEDERVVVEKLLAYHPHSEDKIGSGVDSIMVDRHPQFGNSRCLFVARTDGGWIDFSYRKCLREYIRYTYPTYAERFIQEHF
ncbi:protein DCL, chloroplastic-like [Gastrolobium bilobum]|uniref:protein DCL, chloroplastic-like n=1 Tax=Gastrolobium bilobum TaxID=150636 RepID=UPI002AB14B58|nr:protein DCL, chloroplastic-like [Gastrolobium bilobum]